MAGKSKASKTPSYKQQQVLDLLRARKTIAEVAEGMGITVQAVYGHISRMKSKGIRVPKAKAAGRPTRKTEPAEASSNGSANGRVEDAPAHVKAAVEAIDNAIGMEADIQSRAGTQIKELDEEIGELRDRLTAAREDAKASLDRTAGLREAREKVPA